MHNIGTRFFFQSMLIFIMIQLLNCTKIKFPTGWCKSPWGSLVLMLYYEHTFKTDECFMFYECSFKSTKLKIIVNQMWIILIFFSYMLVQISIKEERPKSLKQVVTTLTPLANAWQQVSRVLEDDHYIRMTRVTENVSC